jgi:hypothetical protein
MQYKAPKSKPVLPVLINNTSDEQQFTRLTTTQGVTLTTVNVSVTLFAPFYQFIITIMISLAV